MSYAKNTEVPINRTQMEIQELLQKHGAHKFAIDWIKGTIGFEFLNRVIKLTVPPPELGAFMRTPSGRMRNASQQQSAYEQALRQRWRALLLIIKAKIEAIQSGVTTFEEEFLASILMGNHQTIGEVLIPRLHRGNLPSLPE